MTVITISLSKIQQQSILIKIINYIYYGNIIYIMVIEIKLFTLTLDYNCILLRVIMNVI